MSQLNWAPEDFHRPDQLSAHFAVSAICHVIVSHGPRTNTEAVELATLEMRGPSFNRHRLPEPTGYIPPAKADAAAEVSML